MNSHKPTSSDDVVYVDYSTSGVGALPYESSAVPTSLASIIRDATVFYTELPTLVIQPRKPGLQPGSIWASDDFDEPLPDEFWAGDE
jgi:hypothetical protein